MLAAVLPPAAAAVAAAAAPAEAALVDGAVRSDGGAPKIAFSHPTALP